MNFRKSHAALDESYRPSSKRTLRVPECSDALHWQFGILIHSLFQGQVNCLSGIMLARSLLLLSHDRLEQHRGHVTGLNHISLTHWFKKYFLLQLCFQTKKYVDKKRHNFWKWSSPLMAAILNCAMTEVSQCQNRTIIEFIVKKYTKKKILQRNISEILHKL